MKFYCAECFEEMGNCAKWCQEAARDSREDHQYPRADLWDIRRDNMAPPDDGLPVQPQPPDESDKGS
jgi:hypothetical protein